VGESGTGATSPSEAIIDSQSIKSAAMLSQDVGFDGGKILDANDFERRYLGVGTTSVCHCGKCWRTRRWWVLKRVNQMGKAVSRLHTIWVDGGFDGEPFMRWVMDVCRWIVQVVLRPKQTKGFVLLKNVG